MHICRESRRGEKVRAEKGDIYRDGGARCIESATSRLYLPTTLYCSVPPPPAPPRSVCTIGARARILHAILHAGSTRTVQPSLNVASGHPVSPLVLLVHRNVHRVSPRGRTLRRRTMASLSVRTVPPQNHHGDHHGESRSPHLAVNIH